jgi:hypothetical protein
MDLVLVFVRSSNASAGEAPDPFDPAFLRTFRIASRTFSQASKEWSPMQYLTANLDSFNALPTVVTSPIGTFTVCVWLSDDDANMNTLSDQSILYSFFNNSTWTNPEPTMVPNGGYRIQSRIEIAINEHSDIIMVYLARDETSPDSAYYNSTSLYWQFYDASIGLWTPPEVVADTTNSSLSSFTVASALPSNLTDIDPLDPIFTLAWSDANQLSITTLPSTIFPFISGSSDFVSSSITLFPFQCNSLQLTHLSRSILCSNLTAVFEMELLLDRVGEALYFNMTFVIRAGPMTMLREMNVTAVRDKVQHIVSDLGHATTTTTLTTGRFATFQHYLSTETSIEFRNNGTASGQDASMTILSKDVDAAS